MLAHPVSLQSGADRQTDLGGAQEQPAVNPGLDLGKVSFGRVEQLLAFAGALRTNQRVAAHDQPLPRKLVRGGDLSKVLLIEQ